MKRVWQTVDGKVFTDQLDAAKHEEEVLQGITMWNFEGARVNECTQAMIVRLVGKNAAHNFKLCNANDNNSAPITDSEICDGDEGIWFWDEYSESYLPIEVKTIRALSKILSEIG